MSVSDPAFLDKVAASLAQAPAGADENAAGSILTVAAGSYGAQPAEDDVTIPTGFDPQVAALFEAVVEAAFLVANADDDFDADERKTFEWVVLKACGEEVVSPLQVEALIADLGEQLSEDGMEKRVEMVSRTINKPEHVGEVLRIAALLGYVSGGVSDVERKVLSQLATAFKLSDEAVNEAVDAAKNVLEA